MRTAAALALSVVAALLAATPAQADRDSSPGHGAGSSVSRPSDPANGSGEFFWDPAAPRAQACGARVCVHYVTTTSDAPPLAATSPGGDGVTPDWVRRNLEVTEFALTRMAELGFPAPPSDGGRGETAQFDVYLADISRAGLYGYCVPETPVPGEPDHASSYCVFDNDFTGFPMPPDESLRVTAAHELFHAVQFGIDVHEDRWFLESTATWIEEQVADDVNDNRQYLLSGQLGRRHVPLDDGGADLGLYGNWIFFQFLAQRYGVDAVRQIWELAGAGPGRRDDFSIEAVRHFVESRHDSFATVYAAFALANLAPSRSYHEGGAYPSPTFDVAVRLGPGRRSWRDRRIGVRHLTARAIALRPQAAQRGPSRLRISVSTTHTSGAAATARVFLRSGRIATLPIRLGRRGEGSRVVNFARSRVKLVLLVVANASTRYDCEQRTPYACQGAPRDDRQRFGVTASLVRARR